MSDSTSFSDKVMECSSLQEGDLVELDDGMFNVARVNFVGQPNEYGNIEVGVTIIHDNQAAGRTCVRLEEIRRKLGDSSTVFYQAGPKEHEVSLDAVKAKLQALREGRKAIPSKRKTKRVSARRAKLDAMTPEQLEKLATALGTSTQELLDNA